MRKIIFTILLVIVGFTLSYGQTAPVLGDGSGGDPYQIATFDNLLWIQADVTRWGFSYIQTANITASPSGSENWDRIGDNGNPFTGSYDGQTNTIDGLVIVVGGSTNQRGLFGVIDGATIENVGVTNISVTNKDRVGALVGECRGTNTITNCYSTGTVVADGLFVGGLIGVLDNAPDAGTTTISDSYSECTVTVNGDGSYRNTGGLIGYAEANDVITNCYATGDVSVTGAVSSCGTGGFIGYACRSTISKSYSIGDVSGGTEDNWAPSGGFAGYNDRGNISECYSRGNVEGYQRVGGFVGYNKNSTAKIENCYSFGNVTRRGGTNTIQGGFVGYNKAGATTENCYSTGSVTSDGSTDKGFVGNNDASTITACFFDATVSNQTTDAGGATAETTTNMQTEATFTAVSWDFTSGTGIWEIVGTNYPRLQNQPDPALPVELTSFEAEAKNGAVLLTWSTATEVNNYGFSVLRLRSATENEWEEIAFVNGAGNSNSPKQYSFVDTSTPLSASVSYRLKQVDTDGGFEYSEVISVSASGLAKTELFQNNPNPFNPTTQISFNLSTLSNVKVTVFNVLGQKVAELLNSKMEAGNHTVNFNASELTSGAYIYRIDTPNYTKSMKMLLLK